MVVTRKQLSRYCTECGAKLIEQHTVIHKTALTVGAHSWEPKDVEPYCIYGCATRGR